LRAAFCSFLTAFVQFRTKNACASTGRVLHLNGIALSEKIFRIEMSIFSLKIPQTNKNLPRGL
jgi:hypothetical protein